MAILAAAMAAAPNAAAEPADPIGIMGSPTCLFAGTWPVTGNWDGVGGDGIGIVVDDGSVLHWYLRNAPNGGPADYVFSYGLTGDWPITGNWDGIGGDGPGIVRQSATFEWQWHLRNGNNSGAAEYSPFNYGRASYWPITGNWDGVGGDSIGVAGGDANGFKAWHLRNSLSAGNPNHDFTYARTGNGDVPMTGNWDGVGGDGPGIRRIESDGQIYWHERNSISSGPADIVFNYGVSGTDCAVSGNWDGIGGDGPGIVRFNPGTGRLQWHLRNGNNPGPAEAIFDYS